MALMNNSSNQRQMERVKKDFLQEMRAKGRLANPAPTEAENRFSKSYYQTGPRLFPGPDGVDAALAIMLAESERMVDAAQVPLKASCSSLGRPPQAETTSKSAGSKQSRKEAQKELQARLDSVSQQLEAERDCRKKSEERLLQAQLEKEKELRRLAELEVAKLRQQQSQVVPGDIVPYRSSSLVNYSSAVGSKWMR